MRLSFTTILASVAALMLHASVNAADPSQAQFDSGKGLTDKMMGTLNGGVNSGSAVTNLQGQMPGFNPNPPEASLYGNPDAAAAQAQTMKDACAAQGAKPTDPKCAALKQSQVTVPKGTIRLDDPVLRGQAVAQNPMAFIGDISKTYSACTVSNAQITSPPTFEDRSCSVNFNFWASGVGCNRVRTVVPKGALNCDPGQVIASTTVYRGGNDKMYVQVMCPVGHTDGKMTFRAYAEGGKGACVGWQNFDVDMSKSTSSTKVSYLSPHWQGGCIPLDVYASGLGCPVGNGTCNQTIHFDWPGREGYDAALNFTKPIALDPSDVVAGCEKYESLIDSMAQKPDGQASLALDQIMGLGAVNQDKSYCTRDSSVCVDGPSTKNIKGIDTTRACWQWANKYTCGDRLPTSTCDPATLKGCTQIADNSCAVKDANGNCTSVTEKFQCQTADATISPAVTCSNASTFCADGSCYDKTYTPNSGLGKSVAVLEATRQAASDFSASNGNPVVFVGHQDACTDAMVGALNCCNLSSFLDPVNPVPADIAGVGCSNDEKKFAVEKAEGKCHTFDSYCDQKIMFLGKQIGCRHSTIKACCFGSKLVRIIHEQGRPQVGRNWGSPPDNPDCSGLSIDELQRMDFSAMDFSEFTADLKVTMPDVGAAQGAAQTKSTNCYYGAGKC